MTYKSFLLTTAISQGISPSTTYLSAPFKWDPSGTGSCDSNPPTAWCPQTYDHTYVGATSIENGLLRSDNTVFARLSLDVGPENIANMAHRLGVRTDLRTSDGVYVPSMGLGSRVVTPMDMASVYSTLAAGGDYSSPMAIRKVVRPGGKVDTEAGWGVPQRKRAVPDWVAAEVVRILEENMTSGTGVGAYFGKTSAGKTGTTDNFADAWFCGFVPALEATVWIGYPRAEIPMRSVHGISVSGPTFPATIWKLFMERASNYAPCPKELPASKDRPIWTSHSLRYAMSAGYAAFKTLLALCGVATLVVIALLLVRLGASDVRIWSSTLLFALSPIALGPISLNTYAAWPAFLTVAALALLLAGGAVAALAVLGV